MIPKETAILECSNNRSLFKLSFRVQTRTRSGLICRDQYREDLPYQEKQSYPYHDDYRQYQQPVNPERTDIFTAEKLSVQHPDFDGIFTSGHFIQVEF